MSHLLRTAVHLAANNVVAAALGFVAWVLTARFFTAGEVGLAATATAGVALASNIGTLGLGGTILRFAPAAKHPAVLIKTALVLACATTLVVALVVARFSVDASSPAGLVAVLAAFAAFAVVISTKALLEGAVVANRSARSVVRATLVSSVSRIALLAAVAAFTSSWPAIFAANALATALAAIVLAAQAHRLSLLDLSVRPTLSCFDGMRRYAISNYATGLVGGIPFMVLPGLVKHRFGADVAAYWYIAILITQVVYMVPSAMDQSLLVEVAHRPEDETTLVRRATSHLAKVMVPVVVFALAVCGHVLTIFGSGYSAATVPLRILIASALLAAMSHILGSLLAIRKHVGAITAINVVNALFVIAGGVWWADSLTDIAWVWTVGELINVALFLVAAYVTAPARPRAGRP